MKTDFVSALIAEMRKITTHEVRQSYQKRTATIRPCFTVNIVSVVPISNISRLSSLIANDDGVTDLFQQFNIKVQISFLGENEVDELIMMLTMLQSEPCFESLGLANIEIYGVTDIRAPYLLNENEDYELMPSFDLELVVVRRFSHSVKYATIQQTIKGA